MLLAEANNLHLLIELFSLGEALPEQLFAVILRKLRVLRELDRKRCLENQDGVNGELKRQVGLL